MSSQELTSPQVLLHELQSPHSPSKNAKSFNKVINKIVLSNTFTIFHCTIFDFIIEIFVLPLIWTLSSTIWSWTADSCSSFRSLNKVFQDFLLSLLNVSHSHIPHFCVTNNYVTFIWDLQFTQTEALALGRGRGALRSSSNSKILLIWAWYYQRLITHPSTWHSAPGPAWPRPPMKVNCRKGE